jgi:hypothetical protein
MTPNAAFHTAGFCAPFDLEPNCTELAVWKAAAAVVPLPRSRLKTHRRGSKAAKAGPDQCIDEFTRAAGDLRRDVCSCHACERQEPQLPERRQLRPESCRQVPVPGRRPARQPPRDTCCLCPGQAVLQDDEKIRQVSCRNVQGIQVHRSARRCRLLQLVTNTGLIESGQVHLGRPGLRQPQVPHDGSFSGAVCGE